MQWQRIGGRTERSEDRQCLVIATKGSHNFFEELASNAHRRNYEFGKR